MLDQYGNEVPTDLIIPPNDVYNEEEYHAIMKARWYDVDIFIAVSCEEIGPELADRGTAFEDAGVDLAKEKVLFVQDMLHRYDDDGSGFYHA